MVKYTPPPDRLDRLNPIQRYMQKGSLEFNDYMWLVIAVLAYLSLRPYTQKAIKWLLAPPDLKEGDEALRSHFESKAKVDANTIRGSKPDTLEVLPEEDSTVTATGSVVSKEGQLSNRKAKNTSTTKSEEEKLLDWDDEPAREYPVGEKTDVTAWLAKWDK